MGLKKTLAKITAGVEKAKIASQKFNEQVRAENERMKNPAYRKQQQEKFNASVAKDPEALKHLQKLKQWRTSKIAVRKKISLEPPNPVANAHAANAQNNLKTMHRINFERAQNTIKSELKRPNV